MTLKNNPMKNVGLGIALTGLLGGFGCMYSAYSSGQHKIKLQEKNPNTYVLYPKNEQRSPEEDRKLSEYEKNIKISISGLMLSCGIAFGGIALTEITERRKFFEEIYKKKYEGKILPFVPNSNK